MKKVIKKIFRKLIFTSVPELNNAVSEKIIWNSITTQKFNSEISSKSKVYPLFKITDSTVDDFTYIAPNSKISMTTIGKFCSIGPNFFCGWGIHPTNGISTAPMFYSTLKQNGTTLSDRNKIDERKQIKIGNDVFIGMNVTILDGITIGDGAIIGAGTVVSKDIPPYAIAVGSPVEIIRYRFSDEQIKELLKIKWWEFKDADLNYIEQYFFNVDKFIEQFSRA